MKKKIKTKKYELRNDYYADDNGHIWSEKAQKYLQEYEDKQGYKKVKLMTMDKPPSEGHRFSVHRLIMTTFYPIDNEELYQVDHINGNQQDNRLENLRWTTCKENLDNPNTKPNRICYDQDGTHNSSAKFNLETLMLLIEDINSGNYTRKEIMNKYDICEETLRKIIKKKCYSQELENIEIIPNFIKIKSGKPNYGEENGHSKLNNEKVLQIIKLLQSKQYSYSEIGKMFGVAACTIQNIKLKKSWKHLTKNIKF